MMEKTPRLYSGLVELLGQPHQWRDVRHLQTLAWIVVGLIHTGCVSLTAWVPFVQGRARYAQSTQRRFARWLHNPRVEVQALYAPLIQQAMAEWGKQRLYLALDTTMLWNRYCVIRISLVYRGRAVPLLRVGICGFFGWRNDEQVWQDRSIAAYWDIVIHTSKLEGGDVLPEGSVSMDGSGHYPHAAFEQTASRGLGVMESGDGVGPVMCPDRCESVFSPGPGAQTQYRAPTVARMVLGGERQTGRPPARSARGELLCAVVGVGSELVGRAATRLGGGCDDVGATLCGAGD